MFLVGLFLTLLAVFLILLVLVQRGRGGGLTGALGGMGGSSAFGAKAGDTFTRITIVVAGIWIASCALAGYWANQSGDRLSDFDDSTSSAPVDAGTAPMTETPSTESAPADSTASPSTAAPTESAAPSPAPAGDAATSAPSEPTSEAPKTP